MNQVETEQLRAQLAQVALKEAPAATAEPATGRETAVPVEGKGWLSSSAAQAAQDPAVNVSARSWWRRLIGR